MTFSLRVPSLASRFSIGAVVFLATWLAEVWGLHAFQGFLLKVIIEDVKSGHSLHPFRGTPTQILIRTLSFTFVAYLCREEVDRACIMFLTLTPSKSWTFGYKLRKRQKYTIITILTAAPSKVNHKYFVRNLATRKKNFIMFFTAASSTLWTWGQKFSNKEKYIFMIFFWPQFQVNL